MNNSSNTTKQDVSTKFKTVLSLLILSLFSLKSLNIDEIQEVNININININIDIIKKILIMYDLIVLIILISTILGIFINQLII